MPDISQLERERDDLERTPSIEDVSQAVDQFADASVRLFSSNAEPYGLILGGAGGDSSQRMQLALSYLFGLPEFRAWLARESKKVIGELSASEKKKRLKQLDGKIASARAAETHARIAAAKAEAEAEVRRLEAELVQAG